MSKFWIKDNKFITNNNKLILCDNCPCITVPCNEINTNLSCYVDFEQQQFFPGEIWIPLNEYESIFSFDDDYDTFMEKFKSKLSKYYGLYDYINKNIFNDIIDLNNYSNKKIKNKLISIKTGETISEEQYGLNLSLNYKTNRQFGNDIVPCSWNPLFGVQRNVKLFNI